MGKQAKIKKARRVDASIPTDMKLRSQRRCERAQKFKSGDVGVSPEPSDSTEPTE